MAHGSMETLYRQVIMDHYKNPRNKGLIDSNAYQQFHIKNPTCGDDITIQVKIEGNQITDIRHEGTGCSICCASASVMSTELKNDSLEVAKDKIELFFEMIKGNEVEPGELLGDAVVFEGVSKYPQRYKCATVAWQALKEVIANG
jgi:nitrogen fixation NifU-like protein